MLFDNTDCSNLLYTLASGEACETVSISGNFDAGTEVWLWVGPTVFSGIPDSGYVLSVCGIANQPVPTVEASWGSLKELYRR